MLHQMIPLGKRIKFANNFAAVETLDELKALTDKLYSDDNPIGFDIETGYSGADFKDRSTNVFNDHQFIAGFSITNDTTWARYVPLKHDFANNLDPNKAWEVIQPLMEEKPVVAHNCFTGDTKAIVRGFGAVALRELEGQTAQVWTDEWWREAKFRNYGKSSVREVVLAPGNRSRSSIRHSFLATPNHRWVTTTGEYVTTDQLKAASKLPKINGTKLKFSLPEFEFDEAGFIHGLIFADGALTSRDSKSIQEGTHSGDYHHQLRLCGDKSKFSHLFNVTYPPSASGDAVANYISHHNNCKELPPENSSDAYVASFLSGWLAMDGHFVSKSGSRILCTVNEDHALWARDNGWRVGLPVFGYSSHSIRSGYLTTSSTRYDITFASHEDASWRVISVGDVSAEEVDVYCAEVVDGPDRFTLVGGILTGNCQFEAENLLQLDHKGDGPRINIFKGGAHDSMIQAYVLSDVPSMMIDGAQLDGEYVRRYLPQFHRLKDDFQDPKIKAFLVGLKSLTKFRYNYDQSDIYSLFNGGKELTADQKKKIRFNTLPVDPKVVHYACDDAYLCLQLHRDQYERIQEDPYLPNVYNLEMKIAETLTEIREVGVSVDWEGIRKHKEIFESYKDTVRITVRNNFEKETGVDQSSLNLRSTKQVSNLLYGAREDGGLELPVDKRTNSGAPSTDDKALTSIRKMSPAVDSLLKYRQLLKMGEWFTLWDGLRDQTHDGKVHPSFMQTRIQSGRFASANPNIQNITKKWWFQNISGSIPEVMSKGTLGVDYWTGNARDFIIASPGYTILSFDYKSAEIQFLAALSQEDAIIQAFYSGEDFHKWTASIVFGKSIGEVTKKERQAAKAQPLSEPVLTPNGWVPMGSIRPGDFVIGSDGKPTRVVDIEPQGVKKIYRVETTDGSTRCTDEHLWTVRHTDHRTPWKTVELRDLMERPLRSKPKREGNGQPKWELPARPVVHYSPQGDLPIDPYALGLLLGDGNFTHDWAPSYSSADPELLGYMRNYHESLGGLVSEKQRNEETFWTQYLACTPYEGGLRNVTRNPLRAKLKELGLDKKKAVDKFVPPMYLTATPEERLALLQGLLDTDGSVLNSGALFHNTSLALCEAVQEIARSLGGKASIRMRREATPEGLGEFGSKLRSYDVYLRLPNEFNPFRLTRKAEKIKKATRGTSLTITDVVEEGEEECQCILVENEDGLYISDHFILTHNTVSFGLVYGQSVSAMAQQLGISREEAQQIRDMYFARFPKLAKYFEDQHELVESTSEVRTWLGRKATIWEQMHSDRGVRSKASRMSVNIPVQGGATGDYTKMAMIRVRDALKKEGLWNDKVRLLMNQHDSLVFEVSNELDIHEVIELITPQVQFSLAGIQGCYNKFETFPPMSVDWEIGPQWGSVYDAREEYVLDSHHLDINLSDDASAEDLSAITDVIITNPGDVPVSLNYKGQTVDIKYSVRAHPDVLGKLKHGDPDNGIPHAPGDKVSAKFRV